MNKFLAVALIAAATGLSAASAHAGGISWSIAIDTPVVGTVISNGLPYPSVAYPAAYPVGRPVVVGAVGYQPVPSGYRPVPAPVYTEPVAVYGPVPVYAAPPAYYAPAPVYAPAPAYRAYPKRYARAPIYAPPPPVVVYAGRAGHHRHGPVVVEPRQRDDWQDHGRREHRGWRHD